MCHSHLHQKQERARIDHNNVLREALQVPVARLTAAFINSMTIMGVPASSFLLRSRSIMSPWLNEQLAEACI